MYPLGRVRLYLRVHLYPLGRVYSYPASFLPSLGPPHHCLRPYKSTPTLHTIPTHVYTYMFLLPTALTLSTQAPPPPLTGYICTRHSLPRPHKLIPWPHSTFHATIQHSHSLGHCHSPLPPPPIPNTKWAGGGGVGGLCPVTCQSSRIRAHVFSLSLGFPA